MCNSLYLLQYLIIKCMYTNFEKQDRYKHNFAKNALSYLKKKGIEIEIFLCWENTDT